MDVRLHIDKLVLDGISVTPAQRSILVASTVAELHRLINTEGVPGTGAIGSSTAALQGGTVSHIPGQFDAESFGRGLAQAVYDGMGRRER